MFDHAGIRRLRGLGVARAPRLVRRRGCGVALVSMQPSSPHTRRWPARRTGCGRRQSVRVSRSVASSRRNGGGLLLLVGFGQRAHGAGLVLAPAQCGEEFMVFRRIEEYA